jgi:hypothetical protein
MDTRTSRSPRGCGRLGLCRARPAHSPSPRSSPQRVIHQPTSYRHPPGNILR